MATTTLAALNIQLQEKQKKLNEKQTALTSLVNDPGMNKLVSIKNDVDRNGYNKQCSKRERQKGYQRDWIDGEGTKWCGDDSTRAYYQAATAITSWYNNIKSLDNEVVALKGDVDKLNKQIGDFSNTPAGQKDLDIQKVKAETEKKQVEAQATQIQSQARIDETKAKNKGTITIILIIVLILALVGGIWWYIKKRKAGKK